MSEISAICKAWVSTSLAGEPAWLATVTEVEGSTSHRPGARLIFTRDVLLAGAVSGGSLEREIALTGPWLARHGPVVKVFDSRLDEEEMPPGTRSEGRVHVLVERLSPLRDGALSVIARELDAERSVAMATIVRTRRPKVPLGARVAKMERGLMSHIPDRALSRLLADAAATALGAVEKRKQHVVYDEAVALVEVLEPPPHLFVFGAGPDAAPLARLASALGWTVTVCGASSAAEQDRFLNSARVSARSLADNVVALERSARPLAVVMSHDYGRDREALAALLRSKSRYVGVLGPAARTARLLADIERSSGPIPPERRAALFGPAGLALGAETAEELALGIAAEAQAVLASSSPSALRS